mmetsp:Transcript_12527/g.12321  ORF Transcript_12527/g.12321 Transcript_12527/m.12321 type:complete len:105 (-) Transcript_12527:1763-2077(-)|eukprot:CAMPEP_0170553396 /NCGR_PEP_ID=MMETSP0211-20121228/11206_1 /TAXON_ID=311385 /ORGANISM="Pseudokeronopsis sp., Strain OXSARD2" /LENGTH=104 /DNA_ID=CAMNT_0010861685 /DNA_START=79 /DNA_END=393 /DNA_ORIENTATION=-
MDLFNDFQRRIQQFESKLKAKPVLEVRQEHSNRSKSRESDQNIAQFYQQRQEKEESERQHVPLGFLPPQKILNPIVFNSSSNPTPLSGTLDKEQTNVIEQLKLS